MKWWAWDSLHLTLILGCHTIVRGVSALGVEARISNSGFTRK